VLVTVLPGKMSAWPVLVTVLPGEMLSWLLLAIVLPYKMALAYAGHFATWQDGGLAVAAQCTVGKIEAWLMLAIVLPSIMADRLEHVTLLPGKMAA
jgi:hypothetical protein